MKKTKYRNKNSENGAIVIMTALVLSVLIAFVALAIDAGFNYYQGAKLQNAVDAAVAAAASEINSDDMTPTVEYYLKANGFDVDKIDDPNDPDDFVVEVEKKSVSQEDSLYGSTVSAGYVKVHVSIKLNTFFGSAIGVSNTYLSKTGCAQCAIHYVNMPEALTKSILATSTKGGMDGGAAMQLNGKLTGSAGEALDSVIGGIESIINGIYQVYYDISQIFNIPNLGTNDLVHINTSEMVVNNDLHSNSDISIGVQAINVSRLKDGNDQTLISTEAGNVDYSNNYGQVTVTALGGINFTNKSNTHVYAQNYDSIQKTAETLELLQKNPETLEAYDASVQQAFEDGNIFESVANMIKSTDGQSGNINISSDKIELTNQDTIVYDIGTKANSGSETSLADKMLQEIEEMGGLSEAMTQRNGSDSYDAAYQDEAKSNGNASYPSYTTDQLDDEGNEVTTKAITISGTQINRQMENEYFNKSSSSYQLAYQNARIALGAAFRQNLGFDAYIETPDMTSYFSRQLWNSIKQSTGDGTIKNRYSSDLIIQQYVDKIKVKYEKQIASNGKYYDESADSVAEITNNLNLYTINTSIKNDYNNLVVKDVEDRRKILGTTVFNGSATELTSPKSAADLVKTGYDKLQEDDTTAKDAVSRFEIKEDLDDNSYKTELKKLSNKYTETSITNDLEDAYAAPSWSVEFDKKATGYGQWLTSSINEDGSPYATYSNTVNRLKTGLTFTPSWSSDSSFNYDNASTSLPNGSNWAGFSKQGNKSGDINIYGDCIYQSYYCSESKAARLSGSNKRISVVGDLTVNKNNFDVGQSGNSNNIVVVGGNLYVADELQLRANSVIYCNGTISCGSLLMEDGAKIYCKGLSTGSTSLSDNIIINSNGAFSCKGITINSDSTLNCTSFTNTSSTTVYGKLNTIGNIISSGNVNVSGTAICNENYSTNGSTTVSGALYSGGTASSGSSVTVSGLLNCKSDFSASGTTNVDGSIYSGGTFATEMFRNNSAGTVVAEGNFYVTKAYDLNWFGGYNYNAVWNDGETYVGGDLSVAYGTLSSGSFYILGNANFATTGNVQDSNSIKLGLNSKTYVGGYFYSNSRNVYIPDDGASTAVFSVYALGAINSGDTAVNNVGDFNLSGIGNKIYINGDADTASISATNIYEKGPSYYYGNVNAAKYEHRDGSYKLYMFKNCALTGNFKIESGTDARINGFVTCGYLENRGKLYVNDYMSVSGDTYNYDIIGVTNNLNVSGKLCNYSDMLLKANSRINGAIENTRMYSLGYIEATNGAITSYGIMYAKNYIYSGAAIVNSGEMYGYSAITATSITNSGKMRTEGTLTSNNGFTSSGIICVYGDLSASSGTFTNNGRAYIAGNLITKVITVGGNGTTEVVGFVNTVNSYLSLTYTIVINATDNHIFATPSHINASSISTSNGAQVYGLESINVLSVTVESSSQDNLSEIFCGPSSVRTNNVSLTINGYFYYPQTVGTWTLALLNVKEYGDVTLNGNVIIKDSFNVNGRLLIQGTTELTNCYMTLSGKAYFVGGLKLAQSVKYNNFNMNIVQGAVLYCGAGLDTSYGTNTMYFSGALQSRGKLYFNCNVRVAGWHNNSSNTSRDCAILVETGDNSICIDGNLETCGNGIVVMAGTMLNVSGYIDYGICLWNGNITLAYGGITQNEHNGVNASTGCDNWNGSGDGFAIRNGCVPSNVDSNSDAIMYSGGGKDLKIGGCFQNYGTYYGEGDLITSGAYKQISVRNQPNSKTFFKGDVYSSSGSAIMAGSMFMCDGDMVCRNATKVNINPDIVNNDQYKSCYLYIGGSFYANVNNGNWDSTVLTSNQGNIDLFSNANMVVKGKMYVRHELHLNYNAYLAIYGDEEKSKLSDFYNQYVKNASGVSIDEDTYNNYALYCQYDSTSDNFNNEGGKYVALDIHPLSRLMVNGGAYVYNDQAKIRDMTKVYINGNFKVSNYLELGKSLDSKDETWALKSKLRKTGETLKNQKYEWSKSPLLSIKGDANIGGFCRVYSSSTIKAGGDCTIGSWLTLRHDSNIYVGKKLKVTNDVDIGSFSEVHTGGSFQSIFGTMKIRDQVKLDVGGNLYASSYIELGKAGDYTRVYKNNQLIEHFGKTERTTDLTGEPDSSGAGGDGGDTEDNTGNTGGNEEESTDTSTVVTDTELGADETDPAIGSTMYIGKSLYSYTSYIKIFHGTDVACGGFVFTPKYLTLRSTSSLNVQPEMFGNTTYTDQHQDYSADDDFLTTIKKAISNIGDFFTPKNGSIYSFGQLTLNKNAALTATYDVIIQGQTLLRKDSLIYCKHDFSLVAPSANLTWDWIKGNSGVTGFDSRGEIGTNGESYPVMIYAGNDISVVTTMDMKMTYMIAGNDVSITNLYASSNNSESNFYDLPNSIYAKNGDIKFGGIYNKYGGLMFAPKGLIDIDGYYMELWGSCIGYNIQFNSYYLNLHRFTNWKRMNLKIPESSEVYLIPEEEYNSVVDNSNG